MDKKAAVLQIILTPASHAEISALTRPLQLEILNDFQKLAANAFESGDSFGDQIATIKKEDRELYRFRARDYRIYFEKTDQGLVIRRILHKNTLKDFLFRSQIPMTPFDEEHLGQNPQFWSLIDAVR